MPDPIASGPGSERPPDEPTRARLRPALLWMSGLLAVAVTVGLMASGLMNSLAQEWMDRFVRVEQAPPPDPEPAPPPPPVLFTFKQLPHHPDTLYRLHALSERTLAPVVSPDTTAPAFQQLLERYENRQRRDDNFTIRVMDERDGQTLEVFTLMDERARYDSLGTVNWNRIDALRRTETRRLVAKHTDAGVPRDDVVIKWGRANQVREARNREAPFIEYEIQLAHYLGLSLLTTEIGTVETFNQDWMVSPVGARSRYQMMPYEMQRGGVYDYELRTVRGDVVPVEESRHPLLVMEPAFLLLRGYINAVGHELPGISAYHTGPGNIYKLYKQFLNANTPSVQSTVLDAYIWGVTDGFNVVSQQSTFKTYSRGYVPTLIGSLRATESMPIDTSATFRAERVQLRPGQRVRLSDLLQHLELSGRELDWGPLALAPEAYAGFVGMNPHVLLPDSILSTVPPEGDVWLTDRDEEGRAVRFFLPLGATQALRHAELNVIDTTATVRFDRSTYTAPSAAELTTWDLEYAELIDSIHRFGFSHRHRATLTRLARQFRRLADEDPSPFRRHQWTIIRRHQQAWGTRVWRDLALAAREAQATRPAPVLPLEPLPVDRQPPTETGTTSE
ncbi:MAG: hypothetical protein AAF970_01620 [Bacteroidota bacterium]